MAELKIWLIDDEGTRDWVSARSSEEALELVKEEYGYTEDDVYGLEATEVTAAEAARTRVEDMGKETSIWELFLESTSAGILSSNMWSL
jgi:hypothetical protein